MRAPLRSMVAMFPVVALLAAGCGGGGGGGDSFPDDSMGLNGVVTPIAFADVLHDGDYRDIQFTDADGYVISFEFLGQGDPGVLAYELPIGDWSGFDAELVQISVYDPSVPEWRAYESGASYSGGLSIDGSPPDLLIMDADFVFSSGGADDFRIRYAGEYSYGLAP